MQVSSYLFQSPYPQSVQFGTPDPVAQAQQKAEEAGVQAPQAGNESAQEAQAYIASVSTGLSVNVAGVMSDPAVQSSLSDFSSLNAQRQAADAYSA